MNIVIWVVQILLALAFFAAGIMKVIRPKEKLAERMAWVNDFSPTIIKAIGAVEVLGAVGLILPALTGILPCLTPLAAVGLGVDMLGAMVTHLRLKESPVGNVVLLVLAAFVVYGRFIAIPA